MADQEERRDYAVPADIAAVWRPLDATEQERATALIGVVARAIRRQWPDTDRRIADGEIAVEDVADVVVWSVLPMLQASTTSGGTEIPANARSYQETSGSESLSVTLDGPATGTFLTFAGWMVDVLTPAVASTERWARSRASNPPSGYYEEARVFQWPERRPYGSPR